VFAVIATLHDVVPTTDRWNLAVLEVIALAVGDEDAGERECAK